MTVLDTVNRVFREFKRYTGDGLPGAPTGAPLPVGDPQSGAHSPKKSEIRAALLAPVSAAIAEADRARDEADRAEAAAVDAMAAGANEFSATRSALKALDTTAVTHAYLTEAGREGQFLWRSGDYTSQVASDIGEGVFVAKLADPTGATGVWARPRDRNPVPDVWFGVVRDPDPGANIGPDSTLAMQRALDFCHGQGCPLIMTKGATFVKEGPSGHALLNRGVSMIGEGQKSPLSRIKPMPSMAATADFVRFQPDGAAYQDYVTIEGFMIQPLVAGTKYGRRALVGAFGVTTNAGQLAIRRMYLAEGNDYSIYLDNNAAINPQGNPSNATIEESSIFDGIWLAGVGDNISVRDNFIISTVGSDRHGIYAYLVDASGGVASMLDIERNAMNANGSAILIDRGRNIKIHKNNIEHSAGSGVNASVVVLRGSGGVLSMPSIKDNAIGVFGASTAQVGINVQATYFAQVKENNIITDVARTHAVAIGSGSSNARVYDNKVSPEWTNNISDAGIGTMSSGFVESGL